MKRVYQYDFDEQDAREYAEVMKGWRNYSTLSFGIFQWIPTKDEKGLKKSKAIRRIAFKALQIDAAIEMAKSITNKLNAGDFSSHKTTTIR